MTAEQKQRVIDIYGPDYEYLDIPPKLRKDEEEREQEKGAEIEEEEINKN